MNRTKRLKYLKILCCGFISISSFFVSFQVKSKQYCDASNRIDSLPLVLANNHTDLISYRLKFEAAELFTMHQIPETKKEWNAYKAHLKNKIIKKTGIVIDHNLPFNMLVTNTIQMNGYSIKNITFQTRPGIHATANLYIPGGEGKFPGTIVMMGHSILGKLYDGYQAVGQSLASNGYVALCIDPWGAGERTTTHGKFEDHGDENNMGSSLMNIGETLMGIQISDNIRGVDLLCSLPYVDSGNIGATGSSGGGNQTMWLAAMDERIKAAVPVVSAGTFESYIMGSPCICEVLPGGLTFTEESGILALIAPRAIKMCNHKQDANPAFSPLEMIRSYKNARPVFKMLGAEDNISYQVFDLTHGYKTADIKTMLSWFDLHLKGISNSVTKEEASVELLPKEKLMVFPSGERHANVISTQEYCKLRGKELRASLLDTRSIDVEVKKNELRSILGINAQSELEVVHEFSMQNGWTRIALETTDNKLIPVLVRLPSQDSKDFIIVCSPEGKGNTPSDQIRDLIQSGKGIAMVDLSGTGEVTSTSSSFDINGNLRTMSRSLLWFGKTLIGEWVKELDIVANFLQTKFNAERIQIDGNKEAGLAALFLGAVEENVDAIVLRNAPVSYLFDTSETIDFFGMGVHLPGFLKWGDVSLAAAISGKSITFINPVTMSGQKLSEHKLKEYETEFEKLRAICGESGKTLFN